MEEHLGKATKAAKYVESLQQKFSDLMDGLKSGEYEDDDIDFALEDLDETLTLKIRGMEEATRAAAELYEQVSQAVKAVEKSGVKIGELTQSACDQAKAALENAQKEEIKARALLTTVKEEITRIKETPTVAVDNEFGEDEEFFDSRDHFDLVDEEVVGSKVEKTQHWRRKN
ncbi:hypothetical protein [Legionella feeleii]|uniref:Uncharacterized protein n=1 Tax=Legionella feeleii TaxID=453 RepID=A0A2X1R372_9GAMM|nr:hypothetical protein [Legionella feeleii]SPX61140.1 Uncharacterised protein [Legionella feeleii]